MTHVQGEFMSIPTVPSQKVESAFEAAKQILESVLAGEIVGAGQLGDTEIRTGFAATLVRQALLQQIQEQPELIAQLRELASPAAKSLLIGLRA